MQTLFGIVLFFSYANFLIVALEAFYSYRRRDSVYSLRGTIGNVLNGVVLRLVSAEAVGLYFGLFALWFTGLGHIRTEFNVLSFAYCLLLVDFMYYLFHRMHHVSSFFWMFHHVHHGDDRLNLSTAYRISWIEQLYLCIFFAPLILVGFDPTSVLLSFYVLVTYQFFCHSQYIKLPRFLDLLLITPNNHRVHHDQDERFHNSNFGGVFSIWDRLFGTYVPEVGNFNPGIKGYRQDNFLWAQAEPIIAYVKRFL